MDGFDLLANAIANDLGPNGKVSLNTKVDGIIRSCDYKHRRDNHNSHHDKTHLNRYGYDTYDGQQNYGKDTEPFPDLYSSKDKFGESSYNGEKVSEFIFYKTYLGNLI